MNKFATLILCLTVAAWAPATAQTSGGFKVEETAFNAGGHPNQGVTVQSASFRISLDSLGNPFGPGVLSSASFQANSGWLPAYLPAGEVVGLNFTDKTTLAWSAHTAAGTYNLYRDQVSNLSGLGFGNCEQQNITGATTTDAAAVPGGDGFFYLVTVENRLADEGTRGTQSSGTERNGSVCP